MHALRYKINPTLCMGTLYWAGLYRLLYISLYSFQRPASSTCYKSRAEDRPGCTILRTLAKEVQIWGHLTTFDRKICFWIEQFALFSLLNTFIFQYLSKPRRRSRNCTQTCLNFGPLHSKDLKVWSFCCQKSCFTSWLWLSTLHSSWWSAWQTDCPIEDSQGSLGIWLSSGDTCFLFCMIVTRHTHIGPYFSLSALVSSFYVH